MSMLCSNSISRASRSAWKLEHFVPTPTLFHLLFHDERKTKLNEDNEINNEIEGDEG